MNETMETTEQQQLLPQDFVQDLRSRWDHVQAAFVDEPRNAVQEADQLVDLAIKRLSDSFGDARNRLEQQWDKGSEVSTEDLRQTLQKYRSFFHRILSI
jgi:hypothetical protein